MPPKIGGAELRDVSVRVTKLRMTPGRCCGKLRLAASRAASSDRSSRSPAPAPSCVSFRCLTETFVVCVMELDKMDENDWKYHGEGNKSLVVSHVQVNQLT